MICISWLKQIYYLFITTEKRCLWSKNVKSTSWCAQLSKTQITESKIKLLTTVISSARIFFICREQDGKIFDGDVVERPETRNKKRATRLNSNMPPKKINFLWVFWAVCFCNDIFLHRNLFRVLKVFRRNSNSTNILAIFLFTEVLYVPVSGLNFFQKIVDLYIFYFN